MLHEGDPPQVFHALQNSYLSITQPDLRIRAGLRLCRDTAVAEGPPKLILINTPTIQSRGGSPGTFSPVKSEFAFKKLALKDVLYLQNIRVCGKIAV